MRLKLVLSNGDTVIVERTDFGLRVIESTYDYLRPPAGSAYYINPSCLGRGKIRMTEFETDTKGNHVGPGARSESERSIIDHAKVD